jgi:hypothetical protein
MFNINIIFIDSSYTEGISTFCLSYYGEDYFKTGTIFHEYISILTGGLLFTSPLTRRNNLPINIEYYKCI